MNQLDLISAMKAADARANVARKYDETKLRYLVEMLEVIDKYELLNPEYDVRLFNGAIMKVNLREEVSRIIFLNSIYENGLSRFFVDFLKLNNIVIDVGAHYGYFSILAAGLVGNMGEVHSFEPTPSTASFLQKNIRGYPQATVHCVAVGEDEGHIDFNDYGVNYSAFNSMYGARKGDGKLQPINCSQVPVTTLDAFCSRTNVKPDIVKIDVESSEMLVLNGMQTVLKTNRPVVVIEMGDFSYLEKDGIPRSAEILSHMIAHSYSLYEPTIDGLIPHALKEDNYEYCNIVCIPSEHQSIENLLCNNV